MAQSLIHFLLVYSLDAGGLLRREEFRNPEAAATAYEAAEAEFRSNDEAARFEVVLVGADSIETVMRTHGHYFADADEAMFADLLASH